MISPPRLPINNQNTIITMSKNIQYDPSIIHEFATSLYKQARSIIVLSTLLGVVIGAVGGGILSGYAKGLPAAAVVTLFVLLCGLVGYSRGRAKAFALKLQAQTALCQLQIENNTRKVEI